VFIGVLVEIITIPVLIAIPILLFLSLKNWKKEGGIGVLLVCFL
jgi:hypothetical protein